ncbi:MAG: patatin-like phospholipase family protein [Alphaproteobacteria bacterium]|nr:patatin-like phospholipase family protein [Alphaproteobacteria bacterium]
MGCGKSIKFAVQGGGSHGAFTWGVLDRPLDDERLHKAAVSGTSAGAVNAIPSRRGDCPWRPCQARKCLGKLWSASAPRLNITQSDALSSTS